MNYPKVTVITVVYNRAKELVATIDNTLSQTYPNIEYIVVDGGSTDGTVEVLESYTAKLRWISEPDNGIYDAMMKGARMATGEWLIFRNAGDFFFGNDTIMKVFSEYTDHGEDLIIGGTRYFVNHYYKDDFPAYPEVDYFKQIPAHHTSTFIRRTTQLAYPYPSRFKQDADIWLFITLLRNGKRYIKIPYIVALFDYRSGATCDHYDITLQERISTFEAYDAPIKQIERLKAILSHWQKVENRKRYFPLNIFYKFTRWYYGYHREWHRYNKFEDLFDNDEFKKESSPVV